MGSGAVLQTVAAAFRNPIAGHLVAANARPVKARWIPGLFILLWCVSSAAPAADGAPGVRTWIVPDTPNGLHPNQNWHSVAGAPNGDIYVSGMDHETNSALYRIKHGTDDLEFVGDAKTASESASNWEPGETAQKFHTHPAFVNGAVCVASLDYSAIDNGYLKRRGFHWYRYSDGDAGLTDLSATEPGGTAIRHGGLATLANDPAHGLLWGATIPGARILSYDPATNVTADHGRPPAFGKGFCYTGRYLWPSKDGKVYFTAGNPAWGQKEPAAISAHVHYFDQVGGSYGERKDWELVEARAIETGQWNRERTRCYLADDLGRVYRYSEDGPKWEQLGALKHDGRWVWVMQLGPDERSIYFVNSGAPKDALYEFDIATGTTRRIAFLEDLSPDLVGRTRHTGHDAWDAGGRFYFTSFPWPADTSLLLVRSDPARLKASLSEASQ